MGYFDDYKLRVSSSVSIEMVNENKQMITDNFYNSPSYFPVSVYTSVKPDIPLPLDSWIVDDAKVKELKQIQLMPDQTLNFGDVVVWNSEYWLTLQVDHMGGIYDRGYIQRCYSSIKWLDSTGEIREAWFTYKTEVLSNNGIVDGRVLSMPNERRNIVVQSNAYTQEITKERRFIFDNRVWKVISMDGLLTGVIVLTLEEVLENTANDNMELRIANYHGNIPSYSLTILNGSNLSLQAGHLFNLSTEVKDRGKVVTKTLLYMSSDPSVASVDDSGMITTLTNGSVIISVSLESDPTVSDSLYLTVQFSTVNNKVVRAIGSPSVLLGETETYTREIKNNGVIDNSSFVQWYLYADDGISVSDLATLSFTSTTQCTIKPNNKAKVGYVKLKCILSGSPSIYEMKRIQIESLI